jgi:hypothetical protein
VRGVGGDSHPYRDPIFADGSECMMDNEDGTTCSHSHGDPSFFVFTVVQVANRYGMRIPKPGSDLQSISL